MTEAAKPTGADEAEVMQKPVTPVTELDTDDGSRSVTKDRDLGTRVTTEADDEPMVIRKPIVIEAQPEE